MRIALILAGWLLSLAALPQEIYRWVDKDGVIHYADRPGTAGAERVRLQGLNEYEAQPANGDTGAGAPEQPAAAYRSLRITRPAPDEVFFGGDARVSVAAEVDGALQPGHTVVFLLDGTRLPEAAGLSTEFGPLERGSHFLRAAVLDQNGEPAITSPQITIHVRQTSIQNPQQRPSAPPAPPTPQPVPPAS